MKVLSHLLLALLVVTACGDTDDEPLANDGDVTLNLRATYNDAPLVITETESQAYVDGTEFYISKLSFYISQIELVRSGDNAAELDEVVLVELRDHHETLADAQSGTTLDFSGVPTGTYTGLRFGIGVPSDLNATRPEDYATGQALANGSFYWDGWNSYIFTKFEGRADTNDDGMFDGPIAYHVGGDELYRTVSFSNLNIVVPANGTATIDLTLDARAILSSSEATLDIINESFSHSNPDDLEHVAISRKVMDNLSQAFEIVE